MARSAGVVSLAIFSSRVTGLVREVLMAQKFGAGFAYDAFLLGFRIPNLTRDLFAEGALSGAFVPTFTATVGSNVRGEAVKPANSEALKLANLVATAILVIVGLTCLLGIILAPAFVRLLAPGYAAIPDKFALAVQLTRIMFPFLLMISLSAQAMGMLNTYGSFGVPALASTFFNVGSVVFGLSLAFWIGPRIGMQPVEGMAFGVVIGGMLQIGWQVPSLWRLGFRFRPEFDWSHPGLRQILRLMIPAFLGEAAVQINVIVNTNLASRIMDPLRGHDGPVSWLSYAFRFVQFPLGLFGVAIASAMAPSVARSASSGNVAEFRQTVSRSLVMVALLTIPSTVGLVVLGRPIIGMVYQGGRFGIYDTQQTSLALACYSIGLFGYACTKIFHPAFYALGDARTPMYVSLSSVLVNFGVASLLLRFTTLGHAALALSTSAVTITAGLLLGGLLRTQLNGIEGRYLWNRGSRVVGAALLMGLPLAFVFRTVSPWFTTSRIGYAAVLSICLPAALALFLLGAKLFGVREVEQITNVLIGLIDRTIGHSRVKVRN